jgi:hypothetical protein
LDWRGQSLQFFKGTSHPFKRLMWKGRYAVHLWSMPELGMSVNKKMEIRGVARGRRNAVGVEGVARIVTWGSREYTATPGFATERPWR